LREIRCGQLYHDSSYEVEVEVDVADPDPVRWIDYDGGVYCIGHRGESYSWDNELPAHEALVHPFRLADRLVTNSEWLAFM
jgi:formylglycine-generating enzyme required for sulfatase activity